MENVHSALSMLGFRARDVITQCEGVIDSIGFDLYGCIQASLMRGFDKDGKKMDSYWFDIKRLTILDKKPVMDPPAFITQARGKEIGPADKSARNI